MRLIQYPSIVEPLSTTAEAVSADRFVPKTNVPERNFKTRAAYSVAALAPFLFFSNTVGGTQLLETMTMDKWIGHKPDIVYDLPRTDAAIYPYISFVNQFPANAVAITQNQVMITFKRVTQYQAWFNPLYNQPESVTIDRFNPQKPDLLYQAWIDKEVQYTYPSLTQDVVSLTQVETSQLDKWLPKYADFAKGKEPNSFAYPSSWPEVEAPEVAAEQLTVDKWYRLTETPAFTSKKQQFQYPNFFIDVNLLTQAEEIIPDTWFRETERPRWDVKRWQFLYPNWTYDLQAGTSAELTSVDRWQPRSNVPNFDKKRWQFIYPYSFIDVSLLTQGENITVEKWFKETERPRWDRKRYQFQYPYFFAHIEEEPVEEVSIDSWYRETERPRWDLKRWQFLFPPVSVPNDLSLVIVTLVKVTDWWRYNENPVLPRFIPYYYPQQEFRTERECEWFKQNDTVMSTDNQTNWYNDNNTSWQSSTTPPEC